MGGDVEAPPRQVCSSTQPNYVGAVSQGSLLLFTSAFRPRVSVLNIVVVVDVSSVLGAVPLLYFLNGEGVTVAEVLPCMGGLWIRSKNCEHRTPTCILEIETELTKKRPWGVLRKAAPSGGCVPLFSFSCHCRAHVNQVTIDPLLRTSGVAILSLTHTWFQP